MLRTFLCSLYVFIFIAFLQAINRVDPTDNSTTFIVAVIPTIIFFGCCFPKIRRMSLILLFPVSVILSGLLFGLMAGFGGGAMFGLLFYLILYSISGFAAAGWNKPPEDDPEYPYEDAWRLKKPGNVTIFPPSARLR